MVKTSDLAWNNGQFGYRFKKGCSSGVCIEIYSQDDGNWFLQQTFDPFWLPALIETVNTALEQFLDTKNLTKFGEETVNNILRRQNLDSKAENDD